MALPVYSPGQVLPAADVNNWLLPVVAVKTGDTSRTSTVTIADDPDLQLPLLASAQYHIAGHLIFQAAAGGDVQWVWTCSGATFRYQHLNVNLSGTLVSATTAALGDILGSAGAGAGNSQSIGINGLITTVGAATLVFRWAQNTSSGTATIMKQYSFLHARRIS